MDAVAASIAPSPTLSVLDAGTGTGHYLAKVLSTSHDRPAGARGRSGLALDASSAAVAMATRRAGTPGLVADTWRRLPIRSGRADLVLCVFAPRNPAEFARVLRPDGQLTVVTPGPRHLTELREAGLVIGMQEDKLLALSRALSPHFVQRQHRTLRYELQLDEAEARDLAGMGPSGHHQTRRRWAAGSVTIEVDITAWSPTVAEGTISQ